MYSVKMFCKLDSKKEKVESEKKKELKSLWSESFTEYRAKCYHILQAAKA